MWSMCRAMRTSEGGKERDIGHSFMDYAEGSQSYISGYFLYTTCKRFKHEAITDLGHLIHDVRHEIEACGDSGVACKKGYEECLGRCGGTETPLRQDFATTVSKSELSEFILGDDFDGAESNCSTKNYVFEVPVFSGGDSFQPLPQERGWRSMTAIDTEWCSTNPLPCGAIQRVLERSPGLVFVNGAFRHVYSLVPPSPSPSSSAYKNCILRPITSRSASSSVVPASIFCGRRSASRSLRPTLRGRGWRQRTCRMLRTRSALLASSSAESWTSRGKRPPASRPSPRRTLPLLPPPTSKTGTPPSESTRTDSTWESRTSTQPRGPPILQSTTRTSLPRSRGRGR